MFRSAVGSSGSGAGDRDNVRAMSMFALALLCATAPLELSQMGFALAGAVMYALMCCMKVSPPKPPKAKAFADYSACAVASPVPRGSSCARPLAATTAPWRRGTTTAIGGRRPPVARTVAQETRKPSVPPMLKPTLFPVARPSLSAVRWDEEVQQLVAQVAPSEETQRIVGRLAAVARRELRRMLPEVEVTGLAYGNLGSGTANGVAVPEVEIVASVPASVLTGRLAQQHRRCGRGVGAPQGQDPRRLQKAALRTCTDMLVGGGGFRFRRSAFRGQDPKVTLLATPAASGAEQAVPMDFSFNSSTPLQNAAMLAECGRLEPRSKDLILLVRRWCKDRGICHSAKGHLSPYAWTLMTIFYLQVGAGEDGSGHVLPPLADFEFAAALGGGPRKARAEAAAPETPSPSSAVGSRKSVGELFKGFVRFYAKEFNFRGETVSVTNGRRGPPSLAMPLHIVVDESGGEASDVAPTVEDPFKLGTNLGSCCTFGSLQRLWEELARADRICTEGGSLAELLELWAPPPEGAAAGAGEANDLEADD